MRERGREREREREMIFSIIESQIAKERKIVATAKSKKILLLAPPRRTHNYGIGFFIVE